MWEIEVLSIAKYENYIFRNWKENYTKSLLNVVQICNTAFLPAYFMHSCFHPSLAATEIYVRTFHQLQLLLQIQIFTPGE
jgi:hypothetical protein